MTKEIVGVSASNGLIEYFNLMASKGALSQQDLSDYQAGKKVFYTADLYVRKYIGQSLSGNIEVITENEVEYPTRCNLSKGRIPAEMNVIMSHLSIKYGVSTTSGDAATPEIVKYNDCIYAINDVKADAGTDAISGATVIVQQIPTVFINAEYELKCDDGLVDRGRMEELLNNNTVGYGVNGNAENKRQLFWPKLLQSDKTLRLTLKFPAVGTVPSSSYFFVELGIKGIYLGKRPGA